MENCPFLGPCLTTRFSLTLVDFGERQNGLSLCYNFSLLLKVSIKPP